MTVEMFVNMTNGQHGDAAIEKIVKHDAYIPYEEKIEISRKIVNETSYTDVLDINGKPTGISKFHVDSTKRWFMYSLAVIRNYTDIEISDNPLKDYNELQKRGLIDKIIDKLPDNEYEQFSTVFKMVCDDKFSNEHSMESIFENKLNTLGLFLDQWGKSGVFK
jgi:hypothetical protein